MIAQLKDLLKLKSLFEKVVIPLLGYLVLGIVQSRVFDWTKLGNEGAKNAVEIGAYVLILVTLYVLLSPFVWLRPSLRVKIYKTNSSQVRPETSEVLYLNRRERQADVTVALEFSPSWWTKTWRRGIMKKHGAAGLKRLGVKFSWQPTGLLSCTSMRADDNAFCEITPDGLTLFPIGRMNFDSDSVFIEYSFRFALGTTNVVQQAHLRPQHLNAQSLIRFGLSFNEEYLLDIREHD